MKENNKSFKKKFLSIFVVLVAALIVSFMLKDINMGTIKRIKGDITSSVSSNSVYKPWSELTAEVADGYKYSTIYYNENTKFYANANSGAEVTFYEGQVRLNKADGTIEDIITPSIKLTQTNQKGQFIIENCGIDEEGNVLSVTIDLEMAERIDDNSSVTMNISKYSVNNGTQEQPLTHDRYTRAQNDVTQIDTEDFHSVTKGMPLKFSLKSRKATAKVKVTYYKNLALKNKQTKKYNIKYDTTTPDATKGLDYALVDSSNSTKATNIDKVNSFYYDIDVSTDSSDQLYLKNGEGVAPLNGKTTVFYAKKNVYHRELSTSTVQNYADVVPTGVSDTYNTNYYISYDLHSEEGDTVHLNDPKAFEFELGTGTEAKNGVYAKTNTFYDDQRYDYGVADLAEDHHKKGDYNIEGIWYGSSTQFLTDNVAGEYSFVYGAYSEVHIGLMFLSPQRYDLDAPKKAVVKGNERVDNETDKLTVKKGETFTYEITQYVPDNKITDVIGFTEPVITRGNTSGTLYSLSFADDIDPDLTIDKDNIKFTDLYGNDFTNEYEVNLLEGNRIQAFVKDSDRFLNYTKIYNNIIKMSIPVSYNKDITETKVIPNKGSTYTKLGAEDYVLQETNTVNVEVTPDETIKLIYDCNGGTATFETNYTTHQKNSTVDVSDPAKIKKVCKRDGYKFLGYALNKTDKAVTKTVQLQDKDKTIYALYEKASCDLNISSSVYQIDKTKKTITVEKDVKDAEIISNIKTTASLSITGDILNVTCDGETDKYTIKRYWVAQTGNKTIKYGIIIGTLIVAIISLVVINKKKKN